MTAARKRGTIPLPVFAVNRACDTSPAGYKHMKKPPLRYRQTGPELDAALRQLEEEGVLPPSRTRLILAAAATTQGRPETVRGVLETILAGGAPVEELREAILQSYLFVGYPRVINALATLREVSGADASTDPPDLRLATMRIEPVLTMTGSGSTVSNARANGATKG